MDSANKVWCLLIDHKKKPMGVPFRVVLTEYVAQLKDNVKELIPNDLRGVDAPELTVWRCMDSGAFACVDYATFGRRLQSIDFNDPNTINVLGVMQKVADLQLSLDQEVLLVQVPKPRVQLRRGQVEKALQNTDLVKLYEHTFIEVKTWGVFEIFDIEQNRLWKAIKVPDFVADFEQKLDSKPGLASNVRGFRHRCDEYFVPHEDSSAEDKSHEEKKRPWRCASASEVMHIEEIAFEEWQRFWQGILGDALTEDLVKSIFFFRLVLHVPDDGVTNAQLANMPWYFNLIIKRATVRPMKYELRWFEPRSDLLITKSHLPRLLVKVQSTRTKQWPQDLILMLLQGAAIVRFANSFLDAFKAKNFVFVAIYIRELGRAIRYTLFQQQNDSMVYYRTKEFSLNESVGRVEFARQLYNFLYMQAGHSEEEYKDTTEKIEQLRDEILEYRLHFATRSFNPKDIQESSGESARTRDSGSADPPDPGDCAELRAHGYEVKPEVIVDDSGGRWEPLFKRPSHILTVFRPSDPSKEFIAKKVRGDSKELEILKLLDAIQPKPEHIIPLLDSFHTQSSPWAILPEMSSVAYYLAIAPSQLSSKVAQVCWGLIKGLAYLHELCIAHRDIKPGNLLVDQDFCLKIIDFDLAMQVDDEDEKVDDQCGTEGWLAPEIKKSLMYSPIKADRWSCGCVLVYLLDGLKKEDKLLRTIGRELQAHNPEERPSLLDWHNWSAARSSDVVGLVKGGERKSLRSRDDGEGMEPPNAKKQRLSVGVGRE